MVAISHFLYPSLSLSLSHTHIHTCLIFMCLFNGLSHSLFHSFSRSSLFDGIYHTPSFFYSISIPHSLLFCIIQVHTVSHLWPLPLSLSLLHSLSLPLSFFCLIHILILSLFDGLSHSLFHSFSRSSLFDGIYHTPSFFYSIFIPHSLLFCLIQVHTVSLLWSQSHTFFILPFLFPFCPSLSHTHCCS